MMANEYKLQTWILAYSSLVFVVTSRDVLSETVLNDWRKLAVLFYEINCEFYLQHFEKTLYDKVNENKMESHGSLYNARTRISVHTLCNARTRISVHAAVLQIESAPRRN